MQDIFTGKEIKCYETTAFMTDSCRNPLWRVETTDSIDCHERDLRRFTTAEARSVGRSYLVAKGVSAYDVTSLEGGLQHYIEDELGMSHGMCLHQEAGAGKRNEFSITAQEKARRDKGLACPFSLFMTIIKTTDRKWFIGPLRQHDAPRRLTACTVTSHDGKDKFNVSVRANKQSFPDTPSVLKDKAAKEASAAKDKERHANAKIENKKKADAEQAAATNDDTERREKRKAEGQPICD